MKERPQTFPEANYDFCIEKLKKSISFILSDSQKFKSYDEFLVNLLKNINPNNKESVSY
jgi:hypothetical protein